MLQLLRNKSLITLMVAETVSGIGSWITIVALFAIIVFDQSGSVLQSSGVLLASLAPMFVFMSVGGMLSDRFNRKWLIIGGQISAALVVLALAFTTSLPLIYTLLALQSVCTSLAAPARMAAIPQIVPQELLTQANALLQQMNALLKVFGPIVAGVLLALMSPQQAMLLDVLSYFISALILLTLPNLLPERSQEQAQAVELSADAVQVAAPKTSLWQVFRSTPLLTVLFGSSFLMITAVMGFDVFASVLTRDVLQADESFFGITISLVGFGAVLASLFLMVRGGESRPWRDLLIGMSLLACLPGMMPAILAAGNPMVARGLMLLSALLGGIGSGFAVVQLTTLLQTLAPKAYMGRVMGLFNTVLIGGQLMALIVVPLLVPSVIPMSVYFAGAACSIMVVVFGTLLLIRGQASKPSLAN